jgi:hypothetical protein
MMQAAFEVVTPVLFAAQACCVPTQPLVGCQVHPACFSQSPCELKYIEQGEGTPAHEVISAQPAQHPAEHAPDAMLAAQQAAQLFGESVPVHTGAAMSGASPSAAATVLASAGDSPSATPPLSLQSHGP